MNPINIPNLLAGETGYEYDHDGEPTYWAIKQCPAVGLPHMIGFTACARQVTAEGEPVVGHDGAPVRLESAAQSAPANAVAAGKVTVAAMRQAAIDSLTDTSNPELTVPTIPGRLTLEAAYSE